MDYWRQLDIVDMERLQKTHVELIGAGGIGSPAALALTKMGVGSLQIWDDDTVEEHNLPNQFHRLNTIGQLKTAALMDLLGEFDQDMELVAQKRMDDKAKPRGIIVSAVDSMKSRKAIWEAAKKSVRAQWFIDARMGGELLRLYSLNPHDAVTAKLYEATLYSDEDAMELPCTAQSIIYTGMIAGGLIASAVKRYVSEDDPIFEIVFEMTGFTLLTR